MTQYEFTFLLNEETELKEIKDLVKATEGKLIKDESWGKKALAYPIKKQTSAVYYNWIVEMDEKKAAEFKRKLNFNEKLLRYLILKVD